MINSHFFAAYDALGAEEVSFIGVEAQLAQAIVKLDGSRAHLGEAQRELQRCLSKKEERRGRIKCCQETWFFGVTALQPQVWLRGGIAGKIARQEAKLMADEAATPGLESEERSALQAVPPLEERVATLSDANARRQGLHAERERMVEVAAQAAPTAALATLTADAARWAAQAQREAAEQREIESNVLPLLQRGLAHYERASRDLQAAGRLNRAAVRGRGGSAGARALNGIVAELEVVGGRCEHLGRVCMCWAPGGEACQW